MTLTLVFPIPPPTTNTLTSRQRAQLLKTTKKLERVLGAAPHIIDTPRNESRPSLHKRTRSVCSTYSSLSSDSSSDSSSTSPILRRKTSLTSSTLSVPRKRSFSPKVHDDLYKMKLPMLHLTVPELDPVPASPISSTFSASSDDSMTSPFSIRPNHSQISDETTSPAFSIPTNNSLRRQKLDRLRRKLGDGVPIELVFREESDSSSDSDSDIQTPIITIPDLKDLPSLPKHHERTISSARDSLILMTTSPSRANKVKRKPVPSFGIVASRPAPPPPSPRLNVHQSRTCKTMSVVSTESKRRARLSLILESPDEHGNTLVEELEVSLVSRTWKRSSGCGESWLDLELN